MTTEVRDDTQIVDPGMGGSDVKAEAKRRLAVALRANLRRRKASRPLNDSAGGATSPGQDARPLDDEQAAGGDATGEDLAGQDSTGRDMAARDASGGDRG